MPYLGYTDNLPVRRRDHRAGHGSPLILPALRRIEFVFAATSDDNRAGRAGAPLIAITAPAALVCRAAPQSTCPPGKLTARAASATRASTRSNTRPRYRREVGRHGLGDAATVRARA